MTNDRFRYVFFTSCISFPFSSRIQFFLFRSFIKLFFCIVFSFRLSIGVCVCRYLFRLELLSFRFVSKLALINDFCALYLWFERGFFPAISKELTNNRGGIGITVGSIRVQSIYFFAAFLLSLSNSSLWDVICIFTSVLRSSLLFMHLKWCFFVYCQQLLSLPNIVPKPIQNE